MVENKNWSKPDMKEKVLCACGCGKWLNRWVDYGGRENKSQIKERKFIHGHNKPWLGKHIYPEMREAIRKRQTGRKHSKETCEKRSRSMMGKGKGRPSPLKGTKGLIKHLRGEQNPLWKGGPPKCKICGIIISASNKSGFRKDHTKLNKRENHYNWKGGVSSLDDIFRKSNAYKEWRKKVFERDNYICQVCGKEKSYLNAHHVKSFLDYPELRLDVSNGITLCKKCHKLTHNWNIKDN